MNGNSGIVPTVDLATNTVPYMYNGGAFGNAFGGDGIWAIVLLALLFNNGGFGGWGNNGYNNLATTDYISSEFTQRDVQNLGTNVSNGFQNTNNLIANGFADNATNICNLRSDVLTGNMGVVNAIQDAKFASAIGDNNTQRDILLQTTQLENQANVNALNMQSKLDECCCNLRAQGIENTQKILDVMNQNTIDDLRSQVNDLKNTITANGIGTSIVNQVRPYPIPAYPVSSPYVGLYNGGFYGNGFYGNTIV
jgi:hypothetical protein